MAFTRKIALRSLPDGADARNYPQASDFNGIYDAIEGATGTTIGAGLVTATGSTTARTLAARFADIVNVKDYGAVGDGVTDDTAAIQAAINSTGTGGDRMLRVVLPAGTFIMSGQITIPEGVALVGAGRWKTKLEFGSLAGVAIQLQTGGTNDYPPILSDFAIHSANTCIDTGGVSGAHIERIWFNAGTAVQVSGTADITINDNWFDGGSNGVVLTAVAHNNVEINRNEFTGIAFGITLNGGADPNFSRDVRIVGNAFRGDATHNIHVYSPSTSVLRDVLIEANTFYTRSDLGAAGSNVLKITGTIAGLKVIGNHIEGANADGFLSDSGAVSGIVALNEFVNTDGNAISVSSTGNLSITGNVFASGIGKAALYKRGAGTVTFRGNDVLDANGTGQVGLDGSAVDVDGASVFYARGNIITDAAATVGLLVRSSVTAWDVSDNLVSGPGTPFALNNTNAAAVPMNGGLQLASPDIVTAQTGRVWQGSGVPSNTYGSNGDVYFRTDGTTGSTMYHKRSGSWVAIL